MPPECHPSRSASPQGEPRNVIPPLLSKGCTSLCEASARSFSTQTSDCMQLLTLALRAEGEPTKAHALRVRGRHLLRPQHCANRATREARPPPAGDGAAPPPPAAEATANHNYVPNHRNASKSASSRTPC